MTKPVEIRCFDYVNRPFESVRTALLKDPNLLFQQATRTATDRANHLAAGLHVNVAGIEIGKEIEILVHGVKDAHEKRDKMVTLTLEWKAAKTPGLFPVMKGDLSAYPLTATETQLDFQGHYVPPLGLMGRAVDAVIGHRIAEASVHSFVTEVAVFLRQAADS